ncbi:MAG TPA: MBOAT family protein [Candidatus Binatia bacterium]|nr:MBOAT family protein [Candidatus Binatia bacterium]
MNARILVSTDYFSLDILIEEIHARNHKSYSINHKSLTLAWPLTGLLGGVLIALTPSKTGIALSTGIAVLCIATPLVLILSAHPIGARIGAFLGGLVMAVPCFVWGLPIHRVLLMCFMAIPFVSAAAFILTPPITGFRARLAYLLTWCGARQITRRPRNFDASAFRNLIVATVVLAAAIAMVKVTPPSGLWLPVRWFTGGIVVLACAEMVTAAFPLVTAFVGITMPPLMRSPWRSTSLVEFWTKRWNPAASQLFRTACFTPLARRSAALALFTAFAASALGHTLLVYLGLGRWTISLACGAFFLVQPLLIAAERRMNIKRWPRTAAWAWTLAALTITSPLFVEPVFQIIERSWNPAEPFLVPTLWALGFVITVTTVISLASLAARPLNPQSLVPCKSSIVKRQS